jgi:peptidoglycan-associated lipoprotein
MGLALIMMVLSCTGDEEASPPPAASQPVDTAREDSLAAVRAETEAVRQMVARMVNFDFDKSAIRPGTDTRVLEEKAAVLQANPALTIEIVGHCDERGTNAYNQALGQRRADAVKRFLVGRGIAAARIATRSMGEEQPIDPGHDEAAWARNRRDEFRVTGGDGALRRPAGG